MRNFEVHCTVEETKLYDVLTLLESLATEIVSVPIKSQSRALVPVPLKKVGRRLEAIFHYMKQHPSFTRVEINTHLAKKGITKADAVLMRLVATGELKRTGVGSYEVANG